MPLAEVIYDFYDKLKSATRGYGTMDYELIGFRRADLVKLDILVNGEPVDALSMIVHRDKAEERGRRVLVRLRKEIPRHLFEIPLQAAIGGKIIARETIKRLRQERHRQVLRRRRHPQAQAAREAEGRQEAHEAGRQRRDPAGGLHGGPGARRRLRSPSKSRHRPDEPDPRRRDHHPTACP